MSELYWPVALFTGAVIGFIIGWISRGKAIIKYIQYLQGQFHNGK
jgi:hypothetical protein